MKATQMKDNAILALKDDIALLLLSIGIGFPMHQFFGGLFLALAGASFARRFKPEHGEREFWVMMLGAALFATVAGEIAHAWWPDFPVQIVMGAAGFFSRYLARFSLRAAGLLESKTDRIVNGALDRVLPTTDVTPPTDTEK